MTKNNTPQLRFSEFTDEWQEKYFSEYYYFIRTNSLSRSELIEKNDGIGNIHYGDIHTKLSINVDLEKVKIPKILNENIKFSNDEFCKAGDLVIADASEDYEDIGKTIEIINCGEQKTVAGLHTILSRPKNKIALGFGSYLFKSNKIRNQLKKLATGVSVLGISKSNLEKLKVIIPSLPEQQKIAGFLGKVDEKITRLEKKKDLFSKYKKSIMQKIFSQQIRFCDENGKQYPDWEEKKLENLIFVVLPPTKIQNNEFKTYGNYPIIDQSQKDIAGYTDNLFYVMPEGEYIIFGDHTECIKFIDFKFAQGADGIKIFQIIDDNIIPKYLYYAFSISYKIEGKYRRHWSMAKKTKIIIPSIQEQQKIADFLTLLDNKIDQINNKLTQAKLFKKSLLQKMFV